MLVLQGRAGGQACWGLCPGRPQGFRQPTTAEAPKVEPFQEPSPQRRPCLGWGGRRGCCRWNAPPVAQGGHHSASLSGQGQLLPWLPACSTRSLFPRGLHGQILPRVETGQSSVREERRAWVPPKDAGGKGLGPELQSCEGVTVFQQSPAGARNFLWIAG